MKKSLQAEFFNVKECSHAAQRKSQQLRLVWKTPKLAFLGGTRINESKILILILID